jgi:tight adherence protein B
VARLQRETGGNTSEVLDHVAGTVRERMELRRTIKTLTAQGRLARWILTGMPPALLLIVYTLNRGYMSTMIHTSTGRFLLVIASLMVLAGSFVIKRIVDMEV